MAMIPFLLILLVALQTGTRAANDKDLDQETTEYIQKAITEFQQQMTNGFPEFNIPPLDPFNVEKKDVTIKTSMIDITMHFPHVEVIGLSTFRQERFHVTAKKLLLDSHLIFNEIQVKGYYFMDGVLMKLLPVYGNGSFVVHSQHPSIDIVLQLDVRNENIDLRVRSLNIDWSTLNFDLENFIGGGDISALIHRLVPVIGKRLLAVFNPQLVDFLEKALNNFLGEQVKKPSVQEMLQKLLQQSVIG